MHKKELLRIGWREWIRLPDLEIRWIKVKIDTGARTSSLHAFDLEEFARGGRRFVRFAVHPRQRDTTKTIRAEAELLENRHVRNSGGARTLRPVILTTLELGGEPWPIELTLVGRDEMGFRMLLGREALRRRAMIDPGRSYLTGKPKFKKKTADGRKRKDP